VRRGKHRAALAVAIRATEAAAAQALEAVGDLVEIAAHLLDARIDRAALRRLVVEQRKESGTVAALALGLHGDAVELGLLLGLGILVAAYLVVARGIAAAAAIDRGKLGFQPRADRIDGRPALLRRPSLRRRAGGRGLHARSRHLCEDRTAQHQAAKQRRGGQKPSVSKRSVRKGVQFLRHIRPMEEPACPLRRRGCLP
jgi:hypothetical protein